MKNTIVINPKTHNTEQVLDESMKKQTVPIKSVPLFYVGHASGTKNKQMIQMAKTFICHDSANKFDLNESGDYVDKYINKTHTQYVMVCRLSDTEEENTSINDDFSSITNDDASINSFLNKYTIKPIFVAVFTVNDRGGLLDLMATSPTCRQY